jgi:hypothetical protein
MKLLSRSIASAIIVSAAVSMSGCLLDLGSDDGNDGNGGGGNGGGGNGGGGGPPPVVHGRPTMSDVHVDQGGEQVWIIHSSVADVRASPTVITAHLGVYTPAQRAFVAVLDTTGTRGKKILFPARDRMLLVTQRGTSEDVYVTIDTAARQPRNQRTYPGNRTNFQMSPSGRAVLSTNAGALHIVDSESLFDQQLPGSASFKSAVWASREDVLYTTRVEAGATRLFRLDLRTANLGEPVALPVLVTTLAGNAGSVAISPDDRFAAAVMAPNSGGAFQIAMIDLVAGTTKAIAGDGVTAFTRDNRVIGWQRKQDGTHDLRLVDPATGAAAPPIATSLHLPVGIPLRQHDLVIATSILGEDAAAFLYRTTDGTRTPMSSAISASSLFERPGRNELWLWQEFDATLRRLDLVTGTVVDMISDVDSVDYRAATDDIVVGTFDHAVFRFSMATGIQVDNPLVLANPNDVVAPYKLGAD